jgi:peptide/nickel transport system substrate-binding protein
VLASLALALGCTDDPKKPTAGDPTGTTAPAPPKAKTKIVLATNSEPDSLDPIFAEMAISTSIRFLGQRELSMYNDKWEIVPDLAEEIPTVENGQVKLTETGEKNPDGTPRQKMEVVWHIKKDAYWEDGTPLTADDYIFGHEVQMDETQEVIDRDTPERVEKMEARGEDKKTLVVTWKNPFAFYNDFKVHPAYPAHLLRPRYKKPDGSTNNMKKDKYGQRPLSNGPFKFKEWVPGQYITFVRNEKYKPLAKLESVTVRFVPNNQALESALVAGDIDACLPMGGLTAPQITDIKKREGDKYKYYNVPGLVWSHIDFNLDDEVLSDVRVRKAIAHGINREEIIEVLFYGQYTVAHTFLPPRHWGYKHDVDKMPFDLAKSASLLEEAGWKQKKEGAVRTNAKGKKLKFKISAVAGIKDIEQLQQIMQSDLKKIGVDLTIDNKPAKVFFGDLARYRKFPHMSFYSWVMDPSSWGHTLWQSDAIPSEANSWAGQNYPGWRNDEASDLLRKVPVELDLKKRKQMIGRVQDLYVAELPAVPMYFRPVVAVSSNKLKGFTPTGTQTPSTWTSYNWEFEQ